MPGSYVLAHWVLLELVDARELCVGTLGVA